MRNMTVHISLSWFYSLLSILAYTRIIITSGTSQNFFKTTTEFGNFSTWGKVAAQDTSECAVYCVDRGSSVCQFFIFNSDEGTPRSGHCFYGIYFDCDHHLSGDVFIKELITTPPCLPRPTPGSLQSIAAQQRMYWITSRREDYNTSRSLCSQEGGNLAIIDSLEIYDHVGTSLQLSRSESYWIGLQRSEGRSSFVWVDGSPLVWEFFAPQEPDRPVGEDSCVRWRTHGQVHSVGHALLDEDCQQSQFYAICSKEN